MYICTDNNDNIVQLITIGDKPENGFEIPDNTSPDILQNLFNYKFINNEFIIKENIYAKQLEKIIAAKIKNFAKICNKIIISGIDFNNEHYSLSEYDQINLSKLETLAKEGNSVLYHSDGNKCRVYDSAEFLELTQFAFTFINFNTTYFNLLKSEIMNCQDIDEVLKINYGKALSEENQQILNLTSFNLSMTIPEIIDKTDYKKFFNDIFDIEQIYSDIEIYENSKKKQNEETLNSEEMNE